jgi:pantoate--beta-alanine ligase
MKLVHTIQELRAELDIQRQAGKKIGLVPTMGALHEGHASLVRRAVAENEVVVVSDFVNPTQFNDKNDLLKYPRTLEADCELLEKEGAAYVFAPSVEEMYPEPDTRQFSYAPLDTVMEGKYRPGHFNGVCQIVSKLFMMVEPDKAYFGEKDFQQLAIIREMVKQMNFPLEIVGCPIVRESDGLALSSRNARLSEEQRKQALGISQTLFKSQEYAASHTLEETQKFVEDGIAAAEGLELEYFEIVDGMTLQKIASWEDTDYVVGCITVFCGEVRLIDNIKYKGTC